MVFTTTLTTQGQVTIPISIRELLGLNPRDKVNFKEEKGRVYIEPAKDFLDLEGSVQTDIKFSDSEADSAILSYKAKEHGKK
jgi:AbrB family looped-hinge helix DNA binding protein